MSQACTTRKGIGRALTAALLAALVLPSVAACQSSPGTGPAAESAPSGRAEADGTYVTGAKGSDDACGRVISAIGYLEPLLLPSGEEKRQKYDAAVRGRFGYVVGTIREYGARLPGSARAAAREAGDISQTLSSALTEDERRPGLLRGYRKAAGTVTAACTPPSS